MCEAFDGPVTGSSSITVPCHAAYQIFVWDVKVGVVESVLLSGVSYYRMPSNCGHPEAGRDRWTSGLSRNPERCRFVDARKVAALLQCPQIGAGSLSHVHSFSECMRAVPITDSCLVIVVWLLVSPT